MAFDNEETEMMCRDLSKIRRRTPSLLGPAVGLLLLAAGGAPSPAAACSICRCGDTTFNALGRDGYSAAGWRLALDWERFDKDEGDPEEGEESQVENRTTALLSYGFNDRFTLVARVPYSRRELTEREGEEEPETTRTSGLSDPELYAQVRLWASSFSGGLGRRASSSISAAASSSAPAPRCPSPATSTATRPSGRCSTSG